MDYTTAERSYDMNALKIFTERWNPLLSLRGIMLGECPTSMPNFMKLNVKFENNEAIVIERFLEILNG
jgi:hypothetical protein